MISSNILHEETINEKIYEIVRHVYGDICPDSYYGKSLVETTIAHVQDTEENVKDAVDKLNQKNHSYWAREPEDEFDSDCVDEDYYFFREHEVKLTPLKDVV